jgi:hypothetical protein
MDHHEAPACRDASALDDDLTINLDEARHRMQMQPSLNRMVAYAQALEARCDALWGYLQGYDVTHDPVTRLIAADLGIAIVDAGGGDAMPAAD